MTTKAPAKRVPSGTTKLVTLHLDGKLLNNRSATALTVILCALNDAQLGAQFHTNSDGTLSIVVRNYMI